ncbi:Gp37Gp68 family protein [Methylorubrum populi BJ001]|jgi:protein gp37|uniref:Gp37Gp68 family protein n=1 Tax=Methylorubrum populi (strain ATCC BAA-705 / NCIMB 13946 / BJ001) TaxID=441620 RepID=B1ZD22_METPB|nr:phage Gp37/Gp68 family protein [Methylorubrum populi]ACB80891.1 Gp37Gp68 family protein [Methylorubrum populi BJ001]
MAQNSKIEWTEATWNPIVGCTIVSPGCTNCYAMKMAARLEAMGQSRYVGLTKPSKAGAVWTGEMRLVDEALTIPLRRKKPTTWFVNSMSDLFHESVPDEWIDRVFAVMALKPQHTFQVLTKRSGRMRAYLSGRWQVRLIPWLQKYDPEHKPGRGVLLQTVNGSLPNVWLGVSAEDQRRADERVPDLLATPAVVRFVSAEPLLGPISFFDLLSEPGRRIDALRPGLAWLQTDEGWLGGTDSHPALDWIITGGEGGPNARPANPQWFRDILGQCEAAGTAYLHKQNGEWVSVSEVEGPGEIFTFPDGRSVRRVGKRKAGRALDGVVYDGMPEVRHVG